MEIRKKYIVLVLVPSLLIQFCGCYSMKEIPKEEMTILKEGGDLIIYTKDSTIYFFEKSNYRVSIDSIHGKGYAKFSNISDFKAVNKDVIALTNIEKVQQDEMNASGTTWLIIGGILFVDILVLGLQVAASLSGI